MSSADTLQVRIQKEIVELAGSISDVVSSFKKLQRPLVESREQVPQAANQLDKITEQTEEVTTRMLDVVEQITQREEEVIRGLRTIRQKATSDSSDVVDKLARDLTTKVEDNLNDAYRIMEYLQFQDITAQQMDHAAWLLENVEGKLHSILETIGASGTVVLRSASPSVRKTRAYDPHADLVDKKTDQSDIDSLFAKKKE